MLARLACLTLRQQYASMMIELMKAEMTAMTSSMMVGQSFVSFAQALRPPISTPFVARYFPSTLARLPVMAMERMKVRLRARNLKMRTRFLSFWSWELAWIFLWGKALRGYGLRRHRLGPSRAGLRCGPWRGWNIHRSRCSVEVDTQYHLRPLGVGGRTSWPIRGVAVTALNSKIQLKSKLRPLRVGVWGRPRVQ